MISLGVKENVTLAAIKSNLAMDSPEEKLQRVIMENKIASTRQQAMDRAEQIEKQKAEMRNKLQAEGKCRRFALLCGVVVWRRVALSLCV